VQFSESLDAAHVAELDIASHGQQLECHFVDFGSRGLLGFQRDWIYRETGSTPPSDDQTVDPLEVIKLLRDPDGLSRGPDWLGPNASERRERLRGMVAEALDVFGDHRDDRMAREIVMAAYLEDGAPHDTIARRLHLSRSAYFRRLHAATQRVSEELAVRLLETG
jgi:hypothetical protein